MRMKTLGAALLCGAAVVAVTFRPATADEPETKTQQIIVVGDAEDQGDDGDRSLPDARRQDVVQRIHEVLKAHLDKLPAEARSQIEAELKKLHAQSDKLQRHVLVQLDAAGVNADDLHKKLEKAGVNAEDIKKQIRVKLDEAGVNADELHQQIELKLKDAGVNAEEIQKKIRAKLDEAGIHPDELHRQIELKLKDAGVNAEEIQKQVRAKLDEAGINSDELHKRIELKFKDTGVNAEEIEKQIRAKLDEAGIHSGELHKRIELRLDASGLQSGELKERISARLKEKKLDDRAEKAVHDKAADDGRKEIRVEVEASPSDQKPGRYQFRFAPGDGEAKADAPKVLRLRSRGGDGDDAERKVERNVEVRVVKKDDASAGKDAEAKVEIYAVIVGPDGQAKELKWHGAKPAGDKHGHAHEHGHAHDDDHGHAHGSAGISGRAIFLSKDGKFHALKTGDGAGHAHDDSGQPQVRRRIVRLGPDGKHEIEGEVTRRVLVTPADKDGDVRIVKVEADVKADGKEPHKKAQMVIVVDGKTHVIELDGDGAKVDAGRRIVPLRVAVEDAPSKAKPAAAIAVAPARRDAAGTGERLDRLEKEMKEIRKILEEIRKK